MLLDQCLQSIIYQRNFALLNIAANNFLEQLWTQNIDTKMIYHKQSEVLHTENNEMPLEQKTIFEPNESRVPQPKEEIEISEPIEEKNINHKIKTDTNGRKVFRCEYKGCSKIYKSKENLKLHVNNIHLKIKPYSCAYCNVQFSHRNGKVYHERIIHEKKLPFKCEFCRKTFPTKSSKTSHYIYKHKHQQEGK